MTFILNSFVLKVLIFVTRLIKWMLIRSGRACEKSQPASMCVCVCFGQTCTDAYRRITVLRYLHLFFLARLSFLSGSNFDAAILCVYVCMCVCLVCHHRLVCDFSHHSPMAPRRSMRRTTAHNNCLCDELYGARCCTKTLVHTVNV